MTRTIPASDVTAATTAAVSWWTSADNRASIACGGAPACEALAELLSQCSDDAEREGVFAGSFSPPDDSDDTEGDDGFLLPGW